MPNDPTNTCGTCSHLGHEANPRNMKDPILVCRRFPPTVLVVGPGNVGGGFPPTRAEWTCGEWAPRFAVGSKL